jgi:uncharacterized membrane protein YfcA
MNKWTQDKLLLIFIVLGIFVGIPLLTRQLPETISYIIGFAAIMLLMGFTIRQDQKKNDKLSNTNYIPLVFITGIIIFFFGKGAPTYLFTASPFGMMFLIACAIFVVVTILNLRRK